MESDDEIKKNLCYYDPENPNNNLDCYDDEERPTPRENCYCDNCFYGRDKLARYILSNANSAGDPPNQPKTIMENQSVPADGQKLRETTDEARGLAERLRKYAAPDMVLPWENAPSVPPERSAPDA